MRMYPTSKRGSRWFAGAAVVIGALVMIVGLVPAASARTVAPAGAVAGGPASAATARVGNCGPWFPEPAAIWLGDPVALYPSRDGGYNIPGSKNVAYKLTGQFPHSTTMSITSYNDLWFLPGPKYLINDDQIIPDPGSVNPFVPGTRVMGKPRNYTAWLWPDSVPVPRGLKNVVLYPTKAAYKADKVAQFFLTVRFYHMQPGYSAVAAAPALTAVSTANPSMPVRCPLRPAATTFPRQVPGVLAHIAIYGKFPAAPEPTTSSKIYFSRYPNDNSIGPEGFAADNCVNYVMGTASRTQISVVTVHQVPQYFNNDLVTSRSIMKDYQTRYLSQTIARFPEYPAISVNTDNAVYTPEGTWVTVYLPGDPRLPASQIRVIREVARELHFNVIQIPRPPGPLNPLGRLLPYPVIIYRNKAVSPSFPHSVTSVPCWAQHHSYLTYPHQTSRRFFRKYASSPRNMGPYYIDGVKLDFAQFMSKYSK
jgi:hypothetical protein